MSESKFKTLRHIETVRNYLNLIVVKILERAEMHDQTKLQTPEVEIFEEYTPKLRGLTYGSDEYRNCLKNMGPAIEHHNRFNPHHPEYYPDGISGMTLIDLIEMLCDWKAATLRHNNGDIYKSLEINKERFGMSEQLTRILKNTVGVIETYNVYNHAEES